MLVNLITPTRSRKQLKHLQSIFGNFGFAFARVEAVPETDRETNRVSIVLRAEPSRRAYVRQF